MFLVVLGRSTLQIPSKKFIAREFNDMVGVRVEQSEMW